MIPASYYYALNAARSLTAASASAQSLFGVGITLAPSTAYEFEMVVRLTLTAGGAGSVTPTIDLNPTGTPTDNTTTFQYGSNSSGFTTATTAWSAVTSTALPPAFSPATFGPSTTSYYTIIAKGIWRTGTGSQGITPRFTASSTNMTAGSVGLGSFFKLIPVGASGSVTSIGAWA